MMTRTPKYGFVERLRVYVTLDIKRYAKFCRGCEVPAGLHMQLYIKVETESAYKSWTCTSCSNIIFLQHCFLCFGGVVPLARSLNCFLFHLPKNALHVFLLPPFPISFSHLTFPWIWPFPLYTPLLCLFLWGFFLLWFWFFRLAVYQQLIK